MVAKRRKIELVRRFAGKVAKEANERRKQEAHERRTFDTEFAEAKEGVAKLAGTGATRSYEIAEAILPEHEQIGVLSRPFLRSIEKKVIQA